MWKEMFEIKTNGRSEFASKIANFVMHRRQLEKRDTIAEFWERRLHDMKFKDDPLDLNKINGINSGNVRRAVNNKGEENNEIITIKNTSTVKNEQKSKQKVIINLK